MFTQLLFCSLIVFSSFSLFAQHEHLPLRIEKKTEKYTETTSKYGSQTRYKSYFELIYRDSSREILTDKKLKTLLQTVPEAKIEWKKYQANSFYKMGSLPLVAVGFLSGIRYFNNPTDKKLNAIMSISGLASGVWMFSYFDHQKQRNQKKIIAYCNRAWNVSSSEPNIKEIISPDIIRFGAIDCDGVGVGFSWYLGNSSER